MKDKAAKIFLYISLVPYGLVLHFGLCCAVFGFGDYISVSYLLSGFITGAETLFYTLSDDVPVIPICIIYQAAYILRRMWRKAKASGQISDFSKKLFKLSFIPCALILLCGIMGVVNDFDDYFFPWGFYYGFRNGAEYINDFAWHNAVIPVCMIYQIAYVLRRNIKAIRKIGRKKYAVGVIVIAVITAGAVLWDTYQDDIKADIKYAYRDYQERRMIRRAEKIIDYGTIQIAEWAYEESKSKLLIDYDKPEVGVIVNHYRHRHRFWSVELTETSPDSEVIRRISKDYYVQTDISLEAPGKRLLSFYYPGDPDLTSAFILVTEDGTVYYADNITDEDSGYGKDSGLSDTDFFIGKGKKLSDLEPLGKAAE